MSQKLCELGFVTSTKCPLQVGIFFAWNGAIWGASGFSRKMRTVGPARLTSLTKGGTPRQLTAAFNCAAASRQLVLHALFCIASVVLGFRVSQQISLVVLQSSYVEDTVNWFDRDSEDSTPAMVLSDHLTLPDALEAQETTTSYSLPHRDVRLPGPLTGLMTTPWNKTGRVLVGRHPIPVREWPHPDPTESMQAYHLLAKVQQEQERLHGVQDPKPVIAITPTYARMFQALHLTGDQISYLLSLPQSDGSSDKF